MSDTHKTKKACKNKRLTGCQEDSQDWSCTRRHGNNRKMWAKLKVTEKRKRNRAGRKNLETFDLPKSWQRY